MTDTSGMPTQFITNLAAFILFLLPKLQSTCMEMSALKVKKPSKTLYFYGFRGRKYKCISEARALKSLKHKVENLI